MQLTYRGIRYESTSKAIDLVPTNIKARFRGNIYTIPSSVNTESHSSNFLLQYRGVTYPNTSVQVQGVATSTTALLEMC